MTKRFFDIALVLISAPFVIPIVGIAALAVWLADRRNPFYVAPRIGRAGIPFGMVKLRSMVVGADVTGVDSTGADDRRITPVGRVIRAWKVDELPQLWNVFTGKMSMVGPRPNLGREVALYTREEKTLLNVAPGITDFASIVFADEGEVLRGTPDPDLAYHQLIRPWKSRLALLYIRHESVGLDVRVLIATAIAVFDRARALRYVSKLVTRLGGGLELASIALRTGVLEPSAPLGSPNVVATRSSEIDL